MTSQRWPNEANAKYACDVDVPSIANGNFDGGAYVQFLRQDNASQPQARVGMSFISVE